MDERNAPPTRSFSRHLIDESVTGVVTGPERGIEVGREAIDQAGRSGEVALAFSVNGDVDGPARREFVELLPRAFEDNPPDLILLETITLIRNGLTMDAIEALVATGIPVAGSTA